VNKIPTVFLRDENSRAHVTPTPNPACLWVLMGEGVATRKYDGTCVRLDDDGTWWARREVKPGKTPPPNYVPVTVDENTGKTMGWEPIEQSAFAKFHAEAVDVAVGVLRGGTYELVGPRINGNPECAVVHRLVAHSTADEFPDAPRDYDGLRAYLTDPAFVHEGIVWHHPDGRMAKLKRKDFTLSAEK
jgi:hypothetical protein